MELTKEQIAMIRDMLAKGMGTSTIETITGATADQIKNLPSDDQSRLSDEDWLKQADERQLTAESPLFLRDFDYDTTAPQTNEGIMQAPYEDRMMEMADRERMGELMRLASMEQYPAEEEEEGNWLRNLLNPQRIGQGITSYAMNQVIPRAGMAFHPLMMGVSALTGGLGNLANTMRGGVSQNAFEQARNQRRTQSRIDYMMDRRAAGKGYSEENLKNLLQQTGQEDTWQPPVPKARVIPQTPNVVHHTGGGGNQPHGTDTSGSFAGKGSSNPFGYARGGLAGLWPRY